MSEAKDICIDGLLITPTMWRTAIHEAAHTAVFVYHGINFDYVKLPSQAIDLGDGIERRGYVYVKGGLPNDNRAFDVLCAGACAEMIFVKGEVVTGARGDWELLRRYLDSRGIEEGSDIVSGLIFNVITLLQSIWRDVLIIALGLLKHSQLTASDVVAMLDAHRTNDALAMELQHD
jgi:hypothetical protein